MLYSQPGSDFIMQVPCDINIVGKEPTNFCIDEVQLCNQSLGEHNAGYVDNV